MSSTDADIHMTWTLSFTLGIYNPNNLFQKRKGRLIEDYFAGAGAIDSVKKKFLVNRIKDCVSSNIPYVEEVWKRVKVSGKYLHYLKSETWNKIKVATPSPVSSLQICLLSK